MTIGDILRSKSIDRYGWDALNDKDKERLLKDLWDMKLLDISQSVNLPYHEVFSANEIKSLFLADPILQSRIMAKYGPKISMTELLETIGNTAILQDLIIAKAANKVNRVMSYLVLKKAELKDDEYDLLGLLLMKFGNPIGCTTPEMFEEKCKEELEELLILNNKGEVKSETKRRKNNQDSDRHRKQNKKDRKDTD